MTVLDVLSRVLPRHAPQLHEAERRAAVAVVGRSGPSGDELLFIHRAEHPLDPWSGHMAFPGGMVDPGDADPLAAGVAVHNERYETPAYAFALASLTRPTFPLPIGVFRAVETPTYEAMLGQQVDDAVAKRGAGSLEGLLSSGDTWTIK